MTTLAFATTPYNHSSLNLKDPRAQEYDVIARITARMRAAQSTAPMNFPALAAALSDNRKLWVELATDVALPANPLPIALKTQILNLAQFTIDQTERVLNGTGTPEALIELNIAIMKGLSGKARDI